MRRKLMTVATGVLAAAGAGDARAEDWRVVETLAAPLALVDADSVVRRADGRIFFRAHVRGGSVLGAFDFYNVAVRGNCSLADDPDAELLERAERTYFLGNRRVREASRWADNAQSETAWIASQLCNGSLSANGFPTLAAGIAEFRRQGSHEQMLGYRTGEVELVGRVSQGFEMNAIALCGSEAGCVDEAPYEFCWLEGNINVPAPPGAPEWVGGGPRRDSADVAFRGRITRSKDGRGFGHVGAYGCQVEVTGPARFITITQRPPRQPEKPAAVRPPEAEAQAAHAALLALVQSAAPLTVGLDGKSWTFDRLTQGRNEDTSGACTAILRKGDDYMSGDRAPGSFHWPSITRIGRQGAIATLVSTGYDENLSWRFATPVQAMRAKAIAQRLPLARIGSVEQRGQRVTVGLSDGRRQVIAFADAAQAAQAAGYASQLRGREIVEFSQYASSFSALPVQRVTVSFASEQQAQEAVRLMERLRSLCGAPPAA
jgi:hypothetical protein